MKDKARTRVARPRGRLGTNWTDSGPGRLGTARGTARLPLGRAQSPERSGSLCCAVRHRLHDRDVARYSESHPQLLHRLPHLTVSQERGARDHGCYQKEVSITSSSDTCASVGPSLGLLLGLL